MILRACPGRTTLPVDHIAIRVVIIIAAAFPLFYGVSAMVKPKVIERVTWTLSRGTVDTRKNEEAVYLLKPLGLYILMFGALLLFSATDPVQHRVIIIWGAALLALRGVQRIFITRQLHALFGIPPARNVVNAAYLLALATTLVALCPAAPH